MMPTSSPIVIRTIQSSDNLIMADIIRQSFFDHGIDHLEGVSLHDPALVDLTAAYQKEKHRYWVALYAGKLAGGCGIAPLQGGTENYCELQKLYVKQDYHGLGIGKALIEHSLQYAKAIGYQYCYLETLPELSKAVGLYEKLGFVPLKQAIGNTGHHDCDIRMLNTL
ncbi:MULTISPECIES: GNAT family N-acetyltransferase [unclassified Vibrio]|uniref:GNAT family N-acetyltransferase n=1 Tax=Vibrio sp. HB236076 TaxID=3232307 RepID=A0AB39HES7_9VIBR|nr:GNAT family N-acetyltransferase [Vibrio sp. HB161653]MDP5255233.1 GNAT family N-acetyltransferase [Vibrio sp. HB161653]